MHSVGIGVELLCIEPDLIDVLKATAFVYIYFFLYIILYGPQVHWMRYDLIIVRKNAQSNRIYRTAEWFRPLKLITNY